ncbi:phospholipase C [Phyllobacterium sp. 1468]|uniref:phosphocholine-specific phospholipase C n=1 Tax=Phyllobacterium sp. 1468 TaxID=2817759 RepID=UPI00286077B1|nr:phospholipase C, phosphocholine-specific [Phyllobacterium sp. 1468]MDR6633650.1 phospholipase C [Phyllobacterium sp. 1468]
MDRRDFIKMLGIAGTSATAYAACSAYMQEALAQSTTIEELLTSAAECPGGKLADIEHVVILMQENRSFDHYFGTLRGVRGFGDPRPLRLRNGKPVWEQSDGARPYRLPKKQAHESGIDAEKIPADSAGSVFLDDPSHSYETGRQAWNDGLMDKWKEYKNYVSFAHYTEADIPLYFKLAKAFTLCDAYFCSHNGATDSNRSYFWSGTCNGLASNEFFSSRKGPRPDWNTYPEKLEALKIDWKFYQDGLTWTSNDAFAGNYGDNTLEFFKAYEDETTALYKKNQRVNSVLRTDANKPSQFEQDIIDDKLPEVSWIVPPEAFTEHPKYPPHFGEYYVHEILRAFAANKKVWHKTLFLITYDENGGFFDHVLPPVPPLNANLGQVSAGIKLTPPGVPRDFNAEYPDKVADDPKEDAKYKDIKPTIPLGMGSRVPMLVISPWSAGGLVNSETFDHTSVIRFLDKWLIARGKQAADAPAFPTISSWRQAIAGDLTSTFDFSRTRTAGLDQLTAPGEKATMLTEVDRTSARAAAGGGYFTPGIADVKADAYADKPIGSKQDKARCEILPIGYDFQVCFRFGTHSDGKKRVEWVIRNRGPLGAAFYVTPYSRTDAPWYYSVEGVKSGAEPIEVTDYAQIENGTYEHAIHGPNGYLFEFSGNSLDAQQTQLPNIIEMKSADDGKKLQIVFEKWQTASGKLKLIDAYSGAEQVIDNAKEVSGTTTVEIATKDGWYDVAVVDGVNANNFLRRIAGHLENGKISKSDPAIGLEYDPLKRVYIGMMA